MQRDATGLTREAVLNVHMSKHKNIPTLQRVWCEENNKSPATVLTYKDKLKPKHTKFSSCLFLSFPFH